MLIVFLDANVLYPQTVRDVLLSGAEADLFAIRWSAQVLDEAQRNLESWGAGLAPPIPAAVFTHTFALMTGAFPEAMVDGYEALIDAQTCNPKDRHVLAAATHAGADVLVTDNIRDFPTSSWPAGLRAETADVFLAAEATERSEAYRAVIAAIAGRNRRAPADSVPGLVGLLRTTLPRLAVIVGGPLPNR